MPTSPPVIARCQRAVRFLLSGHRYHHHIIGGISRFSPLALAVAFVLLGAVGCLPPKASKKQDVVAPEPPVSGTNGMVLIPGGSFTMGDHLDHLDSAVEVEATISPFYMDATHVTWQQWQSVYNYATNHGYNFVRPGGGRAADHPAQKVNWFDAVMWCNARSQQAGKPPVYFTDAALTKVYTTGETNIEIHAKWSAKGYRLPTEAEWEKAARGGVSGRRFPWGDTISRMNAIYNGGPSLFSYDLGPEGYHSAWRIGPKPFTSRAGSFPPNGYGLYDIVGNVYQWCWDWYGTPYAGGVDPHGPATGTSRVIRGGSWIYGAFHARVANRNYYLPSYGDFNNGFRCVLTSGR